MPKPDRKSLLLESDGSESSKWKKKSKQQQQQQQQELRSSADIDVASIIAEQETPKLESRKKKKTKVKRKKNGGEVNGDNAREKEEKDDGVHSSSDESSSSFSSSSGNNNNNNNNDSNNNNNNNDAAAAAAVARPPMPPKKAPLPPSPPPRPPPVRDEESSSSSSDDDSDDIEVAKSSSFVVVEDDDRKKKPKNIDNKAVDNDVEIVIEHPPTPASIEQQQQQQHDGGESGEGRTVYTNDSGRNLGFCSNLIITSKYTALTFLPMNLYQQFGRFANFYFLLIGILQCIPAVSPLGVVRPTILFPLTIVLATSAIKEAAEDLRRRKQDNQVNNKLVQVMRNGQWVEDTWKSVNVGEMVRIKRDESIPADVVMLASDSPFGICYVETSNLDGETNLKQREALEQTAKRFQSDEECGKAKLIFRCEDPNNRLYNFDGSLQVESGVVYPLSPNQVLLRGCSLRNSKWAVGVIINTGADTKLMKNSVPSPVKRSNIEKLTNSKILVAFAVDFVACLILAIGNLIWTSKNATGSWYLQLDDSKAAIVVPAILSFFTNLINFNGMIPISLYVSMELVKLAQMYFMGTDQEMYHDESDTPCMARTSNLNEELGQVQYIFSDKTGTLTRNVMEFRACTVAGKQYEVNPDQDEEDYHKSELISNLNNDGLPEMERNAIEDFLLVLCLCHGVIIEKDDVDDRSTWRYQAASPDENALVMAAKILGFVFIERSPSTVTVEIQKQRRVYDLLNIIDFTSSRKRMTVIIRSPVTGRITLYTKGADNVICDRCMKTEGSQPFQEATLAHLGDYAVTGLRTLCLAKRELTQQQWEEWNAVFHEASIAIKNREEKVAEAAELIERELFLLGGTAIEDRLQDAVPETIQVLSKADVKIWVLTGDKQETAINIGHSSALLTKDMRLLILNASTAQETREKLSQLQDCVEEMRRSNRFVSAADVDDGNNNNNNNSNNNNSNKKSSRGGGVSGASARATGDYYYDDDDYNDEPSQQHHDDLGSNSGTELVAMPILSSSRTKIKFDRLSFVKPQQRQQQQQQQLAFTPPRSSPTDTSTSGASSPLSPDATPRSQKMSHKYDPEKLLNLGLVVDGGTLMHVLEDKQVAKEFLGVAKQCKSVICCRVSPIQKADVVRLVRTNLPVITLAIGDGANDVSMIQAAHLGIGISGKEGLQATLASDYAIAQFRFLQRLMLVHGRWSYRRVSELIVYSFYKNFTFVLCQFWYAFFAGFSGILFYDDLLDGSFNIFFTGLPIIMYASLDQDVPAKVSLNCPWLYVAGQQKSRFNRRVFVTWLANGVWHSFLLYFASYLTFRSLTGAPEAGFIGRWDLGTVTYTGVVLTVSLRLALEISYWTWPHLGVFVLCIGAYYVLSILRSVIPFPDTYYAGVMLDILNRPSYWLLALLIPIVCVMLRDYSWKFVKHRYFSELNHIAKVEHRRQKKLAKKSALAAKRKRSLRF